MTSTNQVLYHSDVVGYMGLLGMMVLHDHTIILLSPDWRLKESEKSSDFGGGAGGCAWTSMGVSV